MSRQRKPLVLHDTLERTERTVTVPNGSEFRFYCCGPTVYGPAHIGNFRTFVLQDVFRRTLELSGMRTLHVRNITDVDDKTIRESQSQGLSLREFTDHWKSRFHVDCEKLNTLCPHVEPSAVEHIPQQIEMIQALLAKDHAYVGADGSIYFRISSFPAYGRLSHLDQRELELGVSATDSDEYEKDSLADFVLWKARKPRDGDNYWDSPWGEGRPGWHLECSAMSKEYLGVDFDLHSGGIDLCFPHHENEIAQSEAATGERMCRHWFHITHLMVNGGKMSKSEGNFYTLSDLESKGFTAAELRYVLISAHYRQPLNFVAKDACGTETFESLRSARQALKTLSKAETELREAAGATQLLSYAELGEIEDLGPFQAAWDTLVDDMNTPGALGQIFTALKRREQANAALSWRGLQVLLGALGLELPQEEVVEVPREILELAQRRWQARGEKNWAEADRLRDELGHAGWKVLDSKQGYDVVPIND